MGLVILALWAWVLPWVAEQVTWDDPVEPGQAIQVTDNVTMTATPGWGVVSGLRTTDDTRSGQSAVDQVVLVQDGVVFSILQGPFSDDVSLLLRQAERITAATDADGGFSVSGDVRDVTTSSGLRGLSQSFVSARNVGVLTAFVVDDVGIEIQVVGPAAQMTAHADDVQAMIDSLARETGDGS